MLKTTSGNIYNDSTKRHTMAINYFVEWISVITINIQIPSAQDLIQ